MKNQSGQVLLVVVLVMVVALTVGLSLASRSIINVNNTNAEANSQKAFQAAEAGIELGLQQPMSSVATTIDQKQLPVQIGGNTTNETINEVDITPLLGSQLVLDGGNPVSQDNGIDVWLTNYPDYSGGPWGGSNGANLNIYWGVNTGCSDAALEVIVISGTSGTDQNATISKYGFDPCAARSGTNAGSNNFTTISGGGTTIGNVTYKYGATVLVKNGLIARIIPLYANTPIGISGQTTASPPQLLNFPLQGRTITSTGSFQTTKRKISFFQTYPQIPVEYFYSILQPK